jgi:hypothetical protein
MPLDRVGRKVVKIEVFGLFSRLLVLALLVAGCGSASSSSSGGVGSDGGIGGEPSDAGPLPLQPGSDCAPGTYVSTPPSGSSPRACAACPSRHFSSAANALRCDAFKTCPSGTYVSRAGTTTMDQGCTPCAEGTTTTGPNQASCVPKDSCPAGTTHREGGGPMDCDVVRPARTVRAAA